MFRTLLLAGVLSLAACGPSEPGPEDTTAEPPYAVYDEMQSVRREFLQHAEAFFADPGADTSRGWHQQTIALMGREDLQALIPESGNWFPKSDCSEGAGDAFDEITKRADAYSVVIINEDHAAPQHRKLIADLVRELIKSGFTHYAAEALYPGAVTPREGHATRAADGWYTQDPQLAALIAELRASGTILVQYEQRPEQSLPDDASMDESINAREEAQANNLIEAVFAGAPETRIIIHVGHAHVYEEASSLSNVWMAARLKAKTGIDPLTIDLTPCEPTGAVPVMAGEMTFRGSPWAPRTDLVVRLPEVTFTSSRPDYRRSADTQDIAVPKALRPTWGLAIIEVRRTGQADEIVPVDRLLLRPGEDIPLILVPGDYVVAAFGAEGLLAEPSQITVTR